MTPLYLSRAWHWHFCNAWFICAHTDNRAWVHQGRHLRHVLPVCIWNDAPEFIKGVIGAPEFIESVAWIMSYLCAYGKTPLNSSRASLESWFTCAHKEWCPWVHKGRHLVHDLPVRIWNDAPEFIKGIAWVMFYLCAYGMTPLSSSRASLRSCIRRLSLALMLRRTARCLTPDPVLESEVDDEETLFEAAR